MNFSRAKYGASPKNPTQYPEFPQIPPYYLSSKAPSSKFSYESTYPVEPSKIKR